MARHLSEGRLAAPPEAILVARLKAAKPEATQPAQPREARREANPLAQNPKLAAKAKLPANPAAEQVPPDQAKHLVVPLTGPNDKPATSAATKWKAVKLSASFCWLANEMCVRCFSWQGKTRPPFLTTSLTWQTKPRFRSAKSLAVGLRRCRARKLPKESWLWRHPCGPCHWKS